MEIKITINNSYDLTAKGKANCKKLLEDTIILLKAMPPRTALETFKERQPTVEYHGHGCRAGLDCPTATTRNFNDCIDK